jgi:hypothetical protein
MLRRSLWALALAGGFALAVGSSLFATVSNLVVTPVTPESARWVSISVPLTGASDGTSTVYSASLHTEDPFALLRHQEIRIRFGTSAGQVAVRGGTLQMDGTQCLYSVAANERLSEGDALVFVQGERCGVLSGTPTGNWTISVTAAPSPRALALSAAFAPEPWNHVAGITVLGTPPSTGSLFLQAEYGDYEGPRNTRRIDLLNYMWQISPSPRWLYAVLGGAIVMMFLGFLVGPAGPVTDASSRLVFAMRAAAGAGLLAGALGISYAVIVPPFQAADESFHFLGYAEINHRADLASEAARWSSLIQFDRIRFHPNERFRPRDVDHPSARWAETTVPDISARSSCTRLWMLFGHVLGRLQTAQTFLGIRMLNVLIWALTIAVCASLAPWLTDVPFPQLLGFVSAFVPTLPFFAMFVSNYAPLTSAYVLLAFAVTVVVLQGKLSDYAGFLMGGSLGLAVTLSRSAVPMAVFCCFVPLFRLAGSSSNTDTKWRAVVRAGVFWGGVLVAAVTAAWVAGQHYIVGTSPGLVLPPRVAQAVRTIFGWHGETNTALYGWLVLAGALIGGAGIEIGVRGALSRIVSRLELPIHLICVALAALVAGTMVLSLWVEFPRLAFFDLLNPPSPFEYVARVVSSELAFFRIRHFDALLSSSFWAGFGWLDTVFPDWFIGLLSGVSGSALIALLLWRRSPGKQLQPTLLLVCAGFLVTLAVYAVVTLRISPDLHGRYLIGLYLAVLSICWIRPAASADSSRIGSRSRCIALAALVLFAHGYALNCLLRRYF